MSVKTTSTMSITYPCGCQIEINDNFMSSIYCNFHQQSIFDWNNKNYQHPFSYFQIRSLIDLTPSEKLIEEVVELKDIPKEINRTKKEKRPRHRVRYVHGLWDNLAKNYAKRLKTEPKLTFSQFLKDEHYARKFLPKLRKAFNNLTEKEFKKYNHEGMKPIIPIQELRVAELIGDKP